MDQVLRQGWRVQSRLTPKLWKVTWVLFCLIVLAKASHRACPDAWRREVLRSHTAKPAGSRGGGDLRLFLQSISTLCKLDPVYMYVCIWIDFTCWGNSVFALQSHENENPLSSLKVSWGRVALRTLSGESGWSILGYSVPQKFSLTSRHKPFIAGHKPRLLYETPFGQGRNYPWKQQPAKQVWLCLSLFLGLWDPWSSDPLAPLLSLFHTNWPKLSCNEDGLNASLGLQDVRGLTLATPPDEGCVTLMTSLTTLNFQFLNSKMELRTAPTAKLLGGLHEMKHRGKKDPELWMWSLLNVWIHECTKSEMTARGRITTAAEQRTPESYFSTPGLLLRIKSLKHPWNCLFLLSYISMVQDVFENQGTKKHRVPFPERTAY